MMQTEGLTISELVCEGYIPLLLNDQVYYVTLDNERNTKEAKTNAYKHVPNITVPMKIRNWDTLLKLYELFIENRKEKYTQLLLQQDTSLNTKEKEGNMYVDAITWNPGAGCNFHCTYCIDSFQKSMKRWAKHNCKKCYTYEPHFHPERLKEEYLKKKIRPTPGDTFIWPFSSGDLTFMKKKWVQQVLDIVNKHPDKTFFFQTKNPAIFQKYTFLENTILGITLETDQDEYYQKKHISKAPLPSKRVKDFIKIDHPRKVITIEPIIKFNLDTMLKYCLQISPERIYIGYDSKNCLFAEPTNYEFQVLKKALEEALPSCKVKTKFDKAGFWKDQTLITSYLNSNKEAH